MIEQLTTWASSHAAMLSWLGLVSLLMLLATPALLPMWVASLPRDYFVRADRTPRGAWAWARRFVAWAAGAVLIVAGLMMIFLPGQGLLTLFAGLSLVPFPGKRRLIARVLGHDKVADGLQWMRRRARRPPLDLPRAIDKP